MSLFRSEISEHLTDPDPELTRKAARTMPGMAHFAGSGPRATTCMECRFWGLANKHTYFAKGGSHGGRIKPEPCSKFRQMMQMDGDKVADHIASCKYFERAEIVPERFAK